MKSKILLKHENKPWDCFALQNKWVALNKNRSKVLYVAKSLETLHKILKKTKEKDVILHYVPPFDGYYSL